MQAEKCRVSIMKLLLFVSGVCLLIVGISQRAEAQNYPCARCITVERMAAGQIAASRALSSAWKPREGSAAIANRIRNTCLRRDRIRRRGFKGVITDSVLVIDIRNSLPAAVLHDERSINVLD